MYIKDLKLEWYCLSFDLLKILVQSSCLQNLEKLSTLCNINAKDVKALAQSPHLQNLRELDLSFNYKNIDVENVKALVQSPHLRNLEKLSIGNQVIDCKTIEAIAELRDPRIGFHGGLWRDSYQIFYTFLLSKSML